VLTVREVQVGQGATAFTLIPSSSRDSAVDRVNVTTAPFNAE